jgi:glycosyltransferase involved in cell wall biosynthesis
LSEEQLITSSTPELVSVIIPTRNRSELLLRAVASVVAQDYRPIQLIVIDNFSDEPVRVNPGDLDYIVHRNSSILNASTNRNLGVRLSTGSLVCFLDDDDTYMPDKLSLLAAALNGVELSYGNTRMVGAGGVTLGFNGSAGGIDHHMLYRIVHTNSTLMRRRMFNQVLFDECMTTFEDVDFILRVFREFPVRHVDQVVAIWNRDGRPDQMTASNLPRAFRNWKVLCERFAREIDQYDRVARFYYGKMCLLALTQWELTVACRFLGKYVSRGLFPRAAN